MRAETITEKLRQTEAEAYRRGRSEGRWQVAFVVAVGSLLAAAAGLFS